MMSETMETGQEDKSEEDPLVVKNQKTFEELTKEKKELLYEKREPVQNNKSATDSANMDIPSAVKADIVNNVNSRNSTLTEIFVKKSENEKNIGITDLDARKGTHSITELDTKMDVSPVSTIEPGESKLVSKVEPSVAKLVPNVEPSVAKSLSKVEPSVTKSISKVEPSVAKLVSTLEPSVAKLVSKVEPSVTKLISNVEPSVTKLVSNVEPSVAKLVSKMEPSMAKLVSNVEPSVAKLVSNVEPSVTKLVFNVEPSVTKLVSNVEPSVTKLVSNVEPSVTKLVSNVEPSVTKLVSNVEPNVTKLVSNVEPSVAKLVSNVEPSVTKLVSNVEPSVTKLVSNVEPSVTKLVSNVEPSVTKLVSQLESDEFKMVEICSNNNVTVPASEQIENSSSEIKNGKLSESKIDIPGEIRMECSSDIKEDISLASKENASSEIKKNISVDIKENVSSEIKKNISVDIKENASSEIKDFSLEIKNSCSSEMKEDNSFKMKEDILSETPIDNGEQFQWDMPSSIVSVPNVLKYSANVSNNATFDFVPGLLPSVTHTGSIVDNLKSPKAASDFFSEQTSHNVRSTLDDRASKLAKESMMKKAKLEEKEKISKALETPLSSSSETSSTSNVEMKTEITEPKDGGSITGNLNSAISIEENVEVETVMKFLELSYGAAVDVGEEEFVWEKYLDETGSNAVPPTAFRHVECSLQSGFVKGMKLEVPNKDGSSTFWVASVVLTCGPLLRLRFEGYEEDSSADFWCDLSTSEVHTIGWCAQNNKTLHPPEGIKSKHRDWGEFLVKALTGARTAPAYLLDKSTGVTPVDQIKRGMKLELQNSASPLHVWIVSVIENVGGRLYLRYEGAETGNHDFWIYYLDYRVHPVGWTKTKPHHSYQPPEEIRNDFADWKGVLDRALQEAQEMILPPDILKDQIEIIPHQFLEGYKLEALNPVTRNQISPATVTKVLSPEYFIVQLDNLQKGGEKPLEINCHALSSGIYPMQWCMGNGIKLTPPKGWLKSDFTWSDYLAYCNAAPAPDTWFNMITPPHEYERGLKLEAVNPNSPNQVCAATITKISGRLLWVHLDSNVKVVASHIEDIESHNLFPVGWCESNGYHLKPPRKASARPGKRVAVVQPERSDVQNKESTDYGGCWCPKIYFNHKCFSGPYLSKGRIAELPKSVGPGSILLVMKEVLTMLINVAYKSCRVLKEIQMEGEPNPNMHQQFLKAKYKAKGYRAIVEICKTIDQLDEFCRNICIKLECCPNLISPHSVGDNCPENCSQLTKTKYTYYYGKKKRKIGRPPGGHTNLENGAKKPGKRKKRRKINLVRKTHSAKEEMLADDDNASGISGSSESKSNDGSLIMDSDTKFTSGKGKRKYHHHFPQPSAIMTRGAKLPKISFERKTHKKILLNSGLVGRPPKSHHQKLSPTKSNGEDVLKLHSNPLSWSIAQVVEFIKTTDCAHLARLFKEHEIDGQALLLLTLPTVQEHMELKLGPAIKLCHHIERVKIAFYETFAK